MHLILLDTCVWLDISYKKAELPMLTALEHLVEIETIKILVPDLVGAEYGDRSHALRGDDCG